MKPYIARKIVFRTIEVVGGWRVKVYTISSNSTFQSNDVLAKAVLNLPAWLKASQQLGLPTYGVACLIVHEGSDGVWSLLNWWIGGEMLQNLTYFTSFEKREDFVLLPREGSMACVWELAVVAHERNAWIKWVLREAESPKFTAYLQDVINETL